MMFKICVDTGKDSVGEFELSWYNVPEVITNAVTREVSSCFLSEFKRSENILSSLDHTQKEQCLGTFFMLVAVIYFLC